MMDNVDMDMDMDMDGIIRSAMVIIIIQESLSFAWLWEVTIVFEFLEKLDLIYFYIVIPSPLKS